MLTVLTATTILTATLAALAGVELHHRRAIRLKALAERARRPRPEPNTSAIVNVWPA